MANHIYLSMLIFYKELSLFLHIKEFLKLFTDKKWMDSCENFRISTVTSGKKSTLESGWLTVWVGWFISCFFFLEGYTPDNLILLTSFVLQYLFTSFKPQDKSCFYSLKTKSSTLWLSLELSPQPLSSEVMVLNSGKCSASESWPHLSPLPHCCLASHPSGYKPDSSLPRENTIHLSPLVLPGLQPYSPLIPTTRLCHLDLPPGKVLLVQAFSPSWNVILTTQLERKKNTAFIVFHLHRFDSFCGTCFFFFLSHQLHFPLSTLVWGHFCLTL